ncbi:helix-turn-helix domain-containing protein, partial [Cupriavidus basilensis]|uniref:helix-turn-helix domain-containing protein n=1 Tax=Cupriavidus basilensis TaxID=68895 RepID=UPI0023E7861A
MRVAPQILLSDAERAELHAAAANLRRGLRARIILLAAEGLQNKAIATHLGIGRVQVARWRDRYAQSRLAGIEHDLPRGAPPVRVDVERLVELAGAPAMERVSTRSLASALGVSASSVSRHWRAKGLPGRHGAPASQSLDLGGRPVEVVGLYVAPREHALAVACRAGGTDEGQPARPNTAMQRHLATSFMTALQLLDADAAALPAASMLHPAFPQSAGWLGFMRELEAKTPDDMTLHLVADNHVAQQHPEVRAWIISHPRIVVHLLAGAPAWRRAVQQVLREAAGGLPAGIPQVLAFMSEPVHWPLRWVRQDSGEPSRSVSPRDASRGDTQMGPLPPEPAHIEPVPGFAPQLHAVALTGQAPNLEPDCGAAEPVASAKLLPPRQGRQLIAREALMARLQDARRRRCVVVQGQAGSGKTSTLATWRKTLISLGFDVCWLALGSEDNDPARFFECLAASLDGIDPGLARGAAVPGGDYDA